MDKISLKQSSRNTLCQFSSLTPILAFIRGHPRLRQGYGGQVRFFLSAVICVFLSAAICISQEIDIKTKIKELKHKDPAVRIQAVRDLGKARNKVATTKLVEELKREKDKHVKCQIIESLSYTNDRSVVPEIGTLLKTEESIDVKTNALISLGALGGDESVRLLKETILDENEDVNLRLTALESLSRFRNESTALETLITATEDKNSLIRKVAIGLLWHNYYLEEKEKIIPILNRLQQDTDEEVKNSVKQMLEFKPGK